MYAYTSDKLYQAILRLFMKEELKFPNLVIGKLTRSSLKKAFSKKITAKQIMNFLQSHAHPQTLKHNVLLETSAAALEDPNSISRVFELTSEKGLASVSQQLTVWEQEMNCIVDNKGVLITFENSRQHEEFKRYKTEKRIFCWMLNEKWKQTGDNVAVVDIKFEKEAFEFINICRS